MIILLSSNHCERPGRIVAIWKGLKSRGLDQRCTMIPSRLATKDEILLVHSNNFYDSLESTKTASKKDLKNREGTLRSIEYTNVI
jgi:histone deacetylase 6